MSASLKISLEAESSSLSLELGDDDDDDDDDDDNEDDIFSIFESPFFALSLPDFACSFSLDVLDTYFFLSAFVNALSDSSVCLLSRVIDDNKDVEDDDDGFATDFSLLLSCNADDFDVTALAAFPLVLFDGGNDLLFVPCPECLLFLPSAFKAVNLTPFRVV